MIPLNVTSTSDAAYSAGLESSAKWITKASFPAAMRCTPSIDGIEKYGDTDDSSSSSSSSSSLDDWPSSTSSVSSSSTASTETDDISVYGSDEMGERIAFLREKQCLLQRALQAMKGEEIYEASIAVGVFKHIHSHPSGNSSVLNSSLCQDARETLDDSAVTTKRPSREDESTTSSTSTSMTSKRLKIDTQSVSCVSASTASDNTVVPSFHRPLDPFPMDGKWMAKAFIHHFKPNSSSSSTTTSSDWKMLKDPYLGDMVIPPSMEPLHTEMQLKDALGFTSTPQLITSAVPPFAVVHANKAFSILSGDQNLMGTSVESIFQVDDDSANYMPDQAFPTRMRLQNQDCQLCLIPIIDRASNPSGGVSHILLKVKSRHQSSNVGENFTNSYNLMVPAFIKSLDEEAGERDMVFTTVG
jgi:hypothetical protein